MTYYDKSISSTLKELKTSEQGLSSIEADEYFRIYGPNIIKITNETLWHKLIEPFKDVFVLVLFIAAVISIVNNEILDAIIIGAIIAFNTIVYYIQRFSTERILKSLQQHTLQNIEVWRDNKIVSIEASLLVPGDIIILNEGDKVPADARLIAGDNVRTNESILTGESSLVDKNNNTLSANKEIYEQSNILFQGSFVVAGNATAVVIGTGNETEFGRIAVLAKDSSNRSPVQQKIDKLIQYIVAVVGIMALITFILSIIRGAEIIESIRFVMALSVSVVPEGLPVAITVVLVLGMRRMAAKKALVRTMSAIETIGVINSIATDKTGTLTENKLTVQEVWQPKHAKTHLATIAYHAINHNAGKSHDPLDIAMIEFSEAEKIIKIKGQPLTSLPFDQTFLMSGNLWHHQDQFHLNIKGSPEQILSRSNLTKAELQEAEDALNQLTSQGYRVIAVATTIIKNPIKAFGELHNKITFEFVGFIAVADVLRAEAKKAIAAAVSAGVAVRMITGDHFETAYQIGKKLGMVSKRNQVFDSRRMRTMSDAELVDIINDIRVFSRVIPEDKFRILELLKKKNITAMTGDGVNDVPAITNADVGIAMGSGSQIAKDASDIILLDDNFKSIVDAMFEGRTILVNIKRMLFYLLSTNAGEALTMVGSLIIGMPVPLLPVQILWVNLVTDTSLALPLGLEPSERDVMRRKPAHPGDPILSNFIIGRIVIAAIGMAIMAIGFYLFFSQHNSHDYAQTIVFSSLVIMQWSNAFNARSDYQSIFKSLTIWNGKFYAGLAIAIALQLLVISGPLQSVLHVATVSISDLLITGIISFLVPIILIEIHKLIGRRLYPNN